MSKPILTPQQQQKTLSAKKKTKKQTIKNILTSPYSNYWPLLNSEDCAIIHDTLQSNLSIIKQEKVRVPWSIMKKIPREDRKDYRSRLAPKIEHHKEGLVFGINETCRLLEKNASSSILLSADVNPPLMVRHIVDLSVLKKTAVLVLPDLKNTLKALTGIGSVAVSFKTNLDCNYLNIDAKIKEICKNYPIPTNHVNYDRCNTFTISKEDEDISDEEMSIEDQVTDEPVVDIYLYRNSNKDRVFKPKLSKTAEDNVIDESGSFLSFGEGDLHVQQNKPNKQKISYKSLIIKRVKNNVDRNKKKIEILKKQK